MKTDSGCDTKPLSMVAVAVVAEAFADVSFISCGEAVLVAVAVVAEAFAVVP